MRISIITACPDAFPGTLGVSVLKKSMTKGLWDMNIVDMHKFATTSRIDDKPYGGGSGMVMRPDVLENAIKDTLKTHSKSVKMICPTPSGKLFNRNVAKELSISTELIFICGRFEGIDQRVIERYHMTKLSLGDYVVSGGDVASMVMIEAILRFVDGIVGKCSSVVNDSFELEGILEHPVYTRPSVWNGLSVPSVLVSGNHEKIKEWKDRNSCKRK
ncbi:tRNA (guanosine(37)-N1)-methyltransferase TrmD [Anaplasmataceae bacterium AB001_6]|nr:tRNA (guanosine(37)-N1)-methyltransferase TrmD [Anaplasmataceae bacterium AB001_6]